MTNILCLSGDNTTKIIISLIWPVTALILAVIFQGSIRDLLRRMQKFKAAGVEADFQQRAEEVREQAEDLRKGSSPATETLLRIAADNPWLGVRRAWLLVQSGLFMNCFRYVIFTDLTARPNER